ncbi:hypothetical protein HK405_007080 [Cladochytrium tenue]|nr:hypothetical protein HK405_007080 [Cladochytrium tenue]
MIFSSLTPPSPPFVDPLAPWPVYPLSAVLSQPSFYVPFAASAAACLAWYFAITAAFRRHITTDRQRAWVLTLLSALVLSLGGTPILVDFLRLPPGASIADLPSLASPRATALAAFFLAYLLVDSAVGCTQYPRQFGWISGVLHHTGYATCVLFLLTRAQHGSFLGFAALLETSTVPLALGHIHHSLRRDLVFGIMFLFTRVLTNAAVAAYAFSLYFPKSAYWIVPALPLPLHIHWFIAWVRQQRRLAKAKATGAVGKDTARHPAAAATEVAKVASSAPAPEATPDASALRQRHAAEPAARASTTIRTHVPYPGVTSS